MHGYNTAHHITSVTVIYWYSIAHHIISGTVIHGDNSLPYHKYDGYKYHGYNAVYLITGATARHG